MFSFINFLLEAVEQDRAVMVQMSTGQYEFGTVQLIDQQGPCPSFQIWRGKDDSPVICIFSHVVTVGWQEPEDIYQAKKKSPDQQG